MPRKAAARRERAEGRAPTARDATVDPPTWGDRRGRFGAGAVPRPGDVVQLDPELHGSVGGCFLIVADVTRIGVIGHLVKPWADDVSGYDVAHGTCKRVGRAAWVRPDQERP